MAAEVEKLEDKVVLRDLANHGWNGMLEVTVPTGKELVPKS